MRRLIPLLAALILVTGCGSDSNESASSTPATTTSATTATATTPTQTATTPTEATDTSSHPTTSTLPAGSKQTTLTGILTEYKIQPSARKIPLGFLKFVGVNKGKVTHIFEIESATSENETADIPPGETRSIELTLRDPGKYKLYCPIHRKEKMFTYIQVG